MSLLNTVNVSEIGFFFPSKEIRSLTRARPRAGSELVLFHSQSYSEVLFRGFGEDRSTRALSHTNYIIYLGIHGNRCCILIDR